MDFNPLLPPFGKPVDLPARRNADRAKKRALDKIDARIQRAYGANCCGIQIDIMDIPRVFEVGRKAIEEGQDDAALAANIRTYVETIRKN